MADPKQQQSEPKTTETTKPKKSSQQGGASKADPTPGELIEGEGSPGLSILGGGGHA